MPFYRKRQVSMAKRRDISGRGGRLLTPLESARQRFPLDSNLIEYRVSQISGIGVFSASFIRKDRRVVEYTGEFVKDENELKRRQHHYKHKLSYSSTYFFALKYKRGFIDSTQCGNSGRFFNHSCMPNCYAQQLLSSEKIVIYAFQDIPAGVELTIDYQLGSDIPCLCKCENCRGFM